MILQHLEEMKTASSSKELIGILIDIFRFATVCLFANLVMMLLQQVKQTIQYYVHMQITLTHLIKVMSNSSCF